MLTAKLRKRPQSKERDLSSNPKVLKMELTKGWLEFVIRIQPGLMSIKKYQYSP